MGCTKDILVFSLLLLLVLLVPRFSPLNAALLAGQYKENTMCGEHTPLMPADQSSSVLFQSEGAWNLFLLSINKSLQLSWFKLLPLQPRKSVCVRRDWSACVWLDRALDKAYLPLCPETAELGLGSRLAACTFKKTLQKRTVYQKRTHPPTSTV